MSNELETKELTVENVEEALSTDNDLERVSPLGEPDAIKVTITNDLNKLDKSIAGLHRNGWVVDRVDVEDNYILVREAGIETKERKVTKTVEETVITTE